MAETVLARELEQAARSQRAIVKAIVALNFNAPDEARDILIAALSDSNFGKENFYGNAAA